MTLTELEERVRVAMKISHGTFITHFKRLRDYEKVLRPTVRPWLEGEKLVIEFELVAEGLGGNIVAGASTFIARFYDITQRYPTAK